MALIAQDIIREKIGRNQKFIYQMQESMMNKYILNVNWARNLSARLENIDAVNGERDRTINHIYEVLDNDYNEMLIYLNQDKTTTHNIKR